MFCRTYIRIQVKNQAKGAIRQSVKQIRATKYQRRRRKPTYTPNLGRTLMQKEPRPTRNRPGEGGREAGPPGCGRTLGAAAPPPPPLGPTFLRWLHAAMLCRSMVVSKNTCAKPIMDQYKQRASAHLSHTPHLELHTSPLLVIFSSQQQLGASKSYQGGLGSLEEKIESLYEYKYNFFQSHALISSIQQCM